MGAGEVIHLQELEEAAGRQLTQAEIKEALEKKRAVTN